jgi:hypothetical protein
MVVKVLKMFIARRFLAAAKFWLRTMAGRLPVCHWHGRRTNPTSWLDSNWRMASAESRSTQHWLAAT